MLEQVLHHQMKRMVSVQLEPAPKMSLLLVVLVLSFQKLELLVQYPVCYRKLEQTTPVLACFQTWVREHLHYSHRLQTCVWESTNYPMWS